MASSCSSGISTNFEGQDATSQAVQCSENCTASTTPAHASAEQKSRWGRKRQEATQEERQLDADRSLSEGGDIAVSSLLKIGPVVEDADRAAKSRSFSGNRGKNARLAHATLGILEAGGYHSPDSQKWVDLAVPMTEAIALSAYFSTNGWRPASLPAVSFDSTQIDICCCTCLAAARELATSSACPAPPGILNFASARNPGGGFSTGASAQEESIARSSALYPCLTKYFDVFFVPSRKAESGTYTHDMIYSPRVPVICDDDGNLLESWYSADILTCAAPNLGVLSQRYSAKEAEEMATECLRERIHRVLQVFAQQGAVDLVLGAWGCGVFGNSPNTVASLFRDELNGSFRHRFRHVIFAVLDAGMAQIFADRFGSRFEAPPAPGGYNQPQPPANLNWKKKKGKVSKHFLAVAED